MQEPDFWNDVDKSNLINKELSTLNKELSLYNKINKDIIDNKELLELLKTDYDEEYFNNLINDINNTEEQLKELEINTLLSGEYDNYDCYLEIHPGAGGTESCDWASMLLRMYERYCDKENYKYEIMEEQSGEEAGIKSVTLHIKGDFA